MNNRFLLFIITSALLLASCSPSRHEVFDCDATMIDFVHQTKSGYSIDNKYLINDEDLNAYSHFYEVLEDNRLGRFLDWTPVYHEDMVVRYVIDFEHGWQVISPDKRGPIVLGYGYGDGRYLDNCNDGELAWFDKLSADIEYRWYHPDEYYDNVTQDEMEAESSCLLFWRAIRADYELLSGGIQTKGGGNLPPPEPAEPPGHYELVYSYNTESPADSIGHLMNTMWGQKRSFNLYCPFEDTSYTDRCPAGCVNIAGAQVLYYLHNLIGVPVSSPTSGYCIGFSHYDWLGFQTGNPSSHFDNFSQGAWSNMVTDGFGNDTTSLFIGSIGVLSDTKYDSTGSATNIQKLVNYAFTYYGINSTYSTNYNTGIIFQNLLNSIPVIISANRYEDLFTWPGHAWVIDGYVTYSVTTHYVYDWVYDDPDINLEEYPLTIHGSYETTSTITGLKWFKMNWGYYGTGNDSHYLTDGVWISPVNNNYCYQYNLNLAYGFTSSQY